MSGYDWWDDNEETDEGRLVGVGVGIIGEGVDWRVAFAFQVAGEDRVFEVVMDPDDATAFMRMIQTAIVQGRAGGISLN